AGRDGAAPRCRSRSEVPGGGDSWAGLVGQRRQHPADMLEHMRRRRDLVARKSHESVATHLPGDTFDLGYRRAPKPRQDYGLRSAVGAVLATLDESRGFKRVEQA